MTKKLIVCCDGTGNEINNNQSNVLKFYHVLSQQKDQLSFYDPGVGTISESNGWEELWIKAKSIFGLATGFGTDNNVIDAYRFLVRNYQKGDHLFFYGFSRGAYTVRVLAGLIHMIGILKPEQEHLIPYALTTYKKASRNHDFTIAWRFNEILKTHRATIRFMGCWDTVGSVIIPQANRFYLPAIENLPFVNENPSVQIFRHALAIDERRRMYRVCQWEEPQLYKSVPFLKDEKADSQDIKQVWFTGVHSDIGGGYNEADSGLAKIPLQWMIDESKQFGLKFRETMVKHLVLGKNPKNSSRCYCEPSSAGCLHDSMSWLWKVLEYLPKRKKYKEWPDRQTWLGFYIPNSEPRFIKSSAEVDESVYSRMSERQDYRPINLP